MDCVNLLYQQYVLWIDKDGGIARNVMLWAVRGSDLVYLIKQALTTNI